MGKNPTGFDGLPMERHHQGRLKGETELIPKTIHDIIHQNERDAVREIFKKDGLKGHPGRWTGKNIKSSS